MSAGIKTTLGVYPTKLSPDCTYTEVYLCSMNTQPIFGNTNNIV